MIVLYLLLLITALLTPLGGGYIVAQVAAIPVWQGTVIFAIVYYAVTITTMLYEFHNASNKD